MATTVPESFLGLTLISGRSWTRTFRRYRKDQTTVIPLDAYGVGYAQIRARLNEDDDVPPLAECGVEIDHDENAVTVRLTAADTLLIPVGTAFFDCALAHLNGVDVWDICPPVPVVVRKGVTSVPGL